MTLLEVPSKLITDADSYLMLPSGYGADMVVANQGFDASNDVRLYRFFLPFKKSFTKAAFIVATSVNTKKFGIGIYSADGSSLLTSGVVTLSASTGNYEITLTTVTLPVNFYLLACTTNDNAVIYSGYNPDGVPYGDLMNFNTDVVGKAGNASVAGVLPATIGSFSADASQGVILAKLY